MSNYENSKIYKIINDINNDIYIGSTIQKLNKRMQGHRSHSRNEERRPNAKLYKLMRELGCDHFKIILIESFNCKNKEELIAREQNHIDLLKPELNTYNAILDVNHRYERPKEVIVCVCGKTYTRQHKLRHFLTKQHINDVALPVV